MVRLLFEMDRKDYAGCACGVVRHSARCITLGQGIGSRVIRALISRGRALGVASLEVG